MTLKLCFFDLAKEQEELVKIIPYEDKIKNGLYFFSDNNFTELLVNLLAIFKTRHHFFLHF